MNDTSQATVAQIRERIISERITKFLSRTCLCCGVQIAFDYRKEKFLTRCDYCGEHCDPGKGHGR